MILFATPAVAQTFIVDVNNGPGTNFTSIESAIAAAPSGALIVVRQGSYSESALTISGKSLTVLGDPGVEILLPPGIPLRIEALGPTQQVVIRDFDIRSSQTSAIVEIQCDDIQGRLFLEALWGPTHSRMLRATDCDWLVAAGCSFQGGGVRCTNSRLVLEDCAVVSLAPVVFLQVGGHVELVETTVSGQVGFGPANTAYSLQGGEVRVSDDSVVAGGIQLPFNMRGRCFAGNGTVRVDPGALLSGSTPLFPPTISVTTAVMPHVTTTPAPLGGRTSASLHGPPGHLGLLAVGFPGTVTSTPLLPDPVWFVPASAVTQAIGTPAPMQPLVTTTMIPAAPGLLGGTLLWHGFTFDPSTGLQVSNPSVRVAH